VAWLRRLAARRLPDDERIRHHSFQREISETWRPVTPRERLLELRARVVHARTGLFDGGPTMLQLALPALLTAIGFVLRAAAPHPHDPRLAPHVPRWVSIGIAALLCNLAIEVVRSPRRVHRVRFVYLAALPLGVAGVVRAALMHSTSWVNLIVRLATVFLGVAILLTLLAARSGRRRFYRLTVVVEVLGAAALAVAETVRSIAYFSDGDSILVAASACTGVGVALLGAALYRSHPEQRVTPTNS
jgi:hypothetical protein